MTQHTFKNPILGIFVQNSGTLSEHCFGAIFDRTVYGQIVDYRPISYIGTDMLPETSRSGEARRTDGGMLLPITPTAASHLIAQLDGVREELTRDPKIQRYYYSPRVKLANSLQAEKGRIPTNCVDYLMQAVQAAGIDIGAVSDTLRNADQVDDVNDLIDKATPENTCSSVHVDAFLRGTTPMHYASAEVDRGTKAVFFRAAENTTVLNALNALPREMVTEVSESKPLGQPTYSIERPQKAKTLGASTPSTGLANIPRFC